MSRQIAAGLTNSGFVRCAETPETFRPVLRDALARV